MLLLGLVLVLSRGAPVAANDALRVQLNWYPQAEYAGMFVADLRQHFRDEGLNVTILPGGAGIDTLGRVQNGDADVAIDWLANAVQRSRPDARLVNVAQIFNDSGLVFVCRRHHDIYTPSDLVGKTVGVWGIGDGAVLDAVLAAENVDPAHVQRVQQKPDGASLIDGDVACVSATRYNEYWSILQAMEPEEIRIFDPRQFGVNHIENGLYVRADRLESEAFNDVLVRFVRALEAGWRDARNSPSLALHATERFVTEGFNRDRQRLMLENVLPLVEIERFGYLDLNQLKAAQQTYLQGLVNPANGPIATHAVWNQLTEVSLTPFRLTDASKHYANEIFESRLFKLFVLIGIATFAISGIIEAVNRGFDLWGRLILAGVSCLGGGTLRDLLLGLEGPLFYVTNPVIPTLVGALVIGVSALMVRFPGVHHSKSWTSIKTTTDIVGFAILAIVGAKVAIVAGAPLGWAPFCAALTCAGGGALRDIATMSQPRTFKGVIYEEIAVVGGLVYVGLLILFQDVEDSVVPSVMSALAAIVIMVALRVLVIIYDIKYPTWLIGKAHKKLSG